MGAKRLISFGINDDWSFEEDFLRLNRVEVDAFDHTIDLWRFFWDAIGSLSRPDRPRDILDRFRTYFGYRSFMRDDVRHHRTAIGYDRPGSKSLTTVMNALPTPLSERVFLKIDIEGYEYRILDQLAEHADQFEGLALEFHDVDLHLPRIQKFLERFPLNLCHIHGNNYSPPDPKGVPIVLEMSFSCHAAQSPGRPVLPHPLDQPNNPDKPDFSLRFLS